MRKDEVDTRRWNEYLTLRQINMLLLFDIGRTKAALVICGLRADKTVTQEGSSGTIHGTSSSILIGKVDILLQL
jgi:hypothetical protein